MGFRLPTQLSHSDGEQHDACTRLCACVHTPHPRPRTQAAQPQVSRVDEMASFRATDVRMLLWTTYSDRGSSLPVFLAASLCYMNCCIAQLHWNSSKGKRENQHPSREPTPPCPRRPSLRCLPRARRIAYRALNLPEYFLCSIFRAIRKERKVNGLHFGRGAAIPPLMCIPTLPHSPKGKHRQRESEGVFRLKAPHAFARKARLVNPLPLIWPDKSIYLATKQTWIRLGEGPTHSPSC